MKIAVCLKRVPDTTAKISIASDGKSIDEAGIKFVPNPYDEFAVEEAIKLKETAGSGETTVIGLGSEATAETLRTALAMGVDKAVLLQSAGSADGFEVARALAAELQAGGYDLIFFGKMAVDDYNHQVGPMVAELLELPCITTVAHLRIEDGTVHAEREIEGGMEVVSCSLPAVLTCDKGLNNPRLPSLKGIMAAKKKPMETRPVTLGAGTLEVVGLALPPERAAGKIVGEGVDAVRRPGQPAPHRSEGALMAAILAVTEQRSGSLRKASQEVVSAARAIADQMGASVDALVLSNGNAAGAGELGGVGADRVLTASHADFTLYNPDGYAATIASIAGQYQAIVFTATATGRDLAPRVAGRLKQGLATDVTAIAVEGGKLVVTRPVYAGKALQKLRLNGSPAILSIRPNTFPVTPSTKAGAAESVAVPAFTARVMVEEIKAAAAATLDVAEAAVVVSGGRGLKEPANFKLLEDLAAAFGNAAVGASRAVVDAGWREHGAQVGQTGKTVSPGLYIAVGISGAIQHLAGMRTAKVIVAINKDKDAPIFKVADYGLVGDLFEIVPKLTEEVKKLRAEH